MTLTLAHGGRCRPCRELWHFLCWARPGAACPDSCGCDCRDEEGLTTQAAWLESARRAPEQLALHLRLQQERLLVADAAEAPGYRHPESVESA